MFDLQAKKLEVRWKTLAQVLCLEECPFQFMPACTGVKEQFQFCPEEVDPMCCTGLLALLSSISVTLALPSQDLALPNMNIFRQLVHDGRVTLYHHHGPFITEI